MITVSAASLVANKLGATQFITRSIQKPIRDICNELLTTKSWLSLKQVPVESTINAIAIGSTKWTIYHKFVKKLLRLPNFKPTKANFSLPKKPLILLSAGSFLGYHKDGKVKINTIKYPVL